MTFLNLNEFSDILNIEVYTYLPPKHTYMPIRRNIAYKYIFYYIIYYYVIFNVIHFYKA